jgi:hypothetical protein
MVKLSVQGGGKVLSSRASFNDAKLKLMFEFNAYRLLKYKRPSDYCVPLLALFTGYSLVTLTLPVIH